MVQIHPQFIVDRKGRKLAVQLPVKEFDRLIDLLEDVEDIAYLKSHRVEKLIPMEIVHRKR